MADTGGGGTRAPPPPSATSAAAAGLHPGQAEQQQQHEGADDRADEADRVEAVDAEVVVLDQVLQETADERADDTEHDGAEKPEGVAAGQERTRDQADDESDDDQDNDENKHAVVLPWGTGLCVFKRNGSAAPGGQPRGDGPVHAGGPAEALEQAAPRGGDVDLAGFGAVPGARGVRVVHVVPALTERDEGE